MSTGKFVEGVATPVSPADVRPGATRGPGRSTGWILVAGGPLGGRAADEVAALLEGGRPSAVVAHSFDAEFLAGCERVGTVPVALPEREVGELARRASGAPYRLRVDLDRGHLQGEDDYTVPFDLERERVDRVLERRASMSEAPAEEAVDWTVASSARQF